MYATHLYPLEQKCRFEHFGTYRPYLARFETKPIILVLGQYSVGKTSLIQYLLKRNYPELIIGPEQTTDRFIVIDYAPDDAVIPGELLVKDSSLPYQCFDRFGPAFVRQFRRVVCSAPFLENYTIIDTPGVLSSAGSAGDKRGPYPYLEPILEFIDRADLILLLFDAHKLDISHELRAVIQNLNTKKDKLRIILNKADHEKHFNDLLHVYGGLLWSLSKIYDGSEVPPVRMGSFWNAPLQETPLNDTIVEDMKETMRAIEQLPSKHLLTLTQDLISRAEQCYSLAVLLSDIHTRVSSKWAFRGRRWKKYLDNFESNCIRLTLDYKLPQPGFLQTKLNIFNLTSVETIPVITKDDVNKLHYLLHTQLPNMVSRLGKVEPVIESNPYSFRVQLSEQWLIPEKTETSYVKQFVRLVMQSGTEVDKKIKREDYSLLSIDSDAIDGLLQKEKAIAPSTLKELWDLAHPSKSNKWDIIQFITLKHLLYLTKRNKGIYPAYVEPLFTASLKQKYSFSSVPNSPDSSSATESPTANNQTASSDL